VIAEPEVRRAGGHLPCLAGGGRRLLKFRDMEASLSTDIKAAVLSVSELTRQLKGALESSFGEIWVSGEVTNFRVPASGHFYFSLKDERSQIAVVMFRGANRRLRFRPEDGLQVVVRGRVSLYEARGDLQLYAEIMEPRGVGSQQLALEQLKKRLAAEGLFDASRKRALPFWPRAVGVATARRGAAIHDIITTLRARMPQVPVVIRPVRVQGEGAGCDVAAAIEELNSVPEIDALIIGRGGGSVEDLWAFNEEIVVRAVATSRAPVISAVGHEIDVSLTDLAADCRAATPTAAAVLVVPDGRELAREIARVCGALTGAVEKQLRQERQRLRATAKRLRDPSRIMRAERLHIDELAERGRRALEGMLRLAGERLRGDAERLHVLSPLSVLDRGYAIARFWPEGRIIRAGSEVAPEDRLRVAFARGWARVRVEESE